MYYTKSIKNQLSEWEKRIINSSSDQLANQLKFFFLNIESNRVLSNIIQDLTLKYKYNKEQFDKIFDDYDSSIEVKQILTFKNESQNAAFCYQFIQSFVDNYSNGEYEFHNYTVFKTQSFEETKKQLIDKYIIPIFNHLNDCLEDSNSITYLLERYKKRTEWFTKEKLKELYQNVTNKNYEQVLEDDLRLFLFDQGVEYPFSTPKSTSGRTDIVGQIDSSQPIIIEIKVIDKNKGYGLSRIKDGFSQIVKYTNDYNKDFGYLVIFNFDNVEINYCFGKDNKLFPPMLTFNNKTYFFITVNLNSDKTASKQGALELLNVKEEELTKLL